MEEKRWIDFIPDDVWENLDEITKKELIKFQDKYRITILINPKTNRNIIKKMDEELIENAWKKFMEVLTQETMDGCDGASDEFVLGIIEEHLKREFPDKEFRF